MRIVLLALELALAGCGNTALKKIGTDFNQSLESYKACVRASGPDACRKEKAILDADAQRYQSTWAAVNGSIRAADDGPAVLQPVGGGTYIKY